MKKFALFLVFTCLAAGFLFAQGYTVQTATGRVLKGTGYNKADIVEGEYLTAETFISVSAGALLVLTDGEHTFTITAGYSGTVTDSPPVLRIRRGPPAPRADRRTSRRAAPPAVVQENAPVHHITTDGHHEDIIFSNEHVEIKVVTETGHEAREEGSHHE